MEQYRGRKKICCLDSGAWTWFIGWYQVVGSLIPIILLGMLLDQYMADYHLFLTANMAVPGSNKLITEGYCKNLTLVTVIATLQLILMMLNFIMGFFLLWGYYNRSPDQIQVWTDFTVIFVVVWELISLAQYSVNTCGSGEVTVQFLGLVISVAIQGFSVWVVTIFKKELILITDEPLLRIPVKI